MFWERVILAALEIEAGPLFMGVGLFFAFAAWACLTFGVLMVTETSLSLCDFLPACVSVLVSVSVSVFLSLARALSLFLSLCL